MKWLDFEKENFRVLFRSVMAILALLYVGAYTWNITFLAEGETVSQHAQVILGFFLGTLLATLINYYFGGNENGQTTQPAVDRDGDGIPDDPLLDGLPSEREVISGDES